MVKVLRLSDLPEQPVDEAKEEANLVLAMSKMLLKDEIKSKPVRADGVILTRKKRVAPAGGMAEEKTSGVKKPIQKVKGKLKGKRDKVFR